jgi:hypothetical protein
MRRSSPACTQLAGDSLIPLFGLPVSRVMWCNFIGFTAANRPAFGVYVDQGSGFFFAGNYFI